MKKRGKRIAAAFLSLVLVLGSLVITPLSAKADTYVDYSSSKATWHVEYENGDIVLHMYDKGRDPNAVIGFKTIGFTVSRCKMDNKELYDGVNSDWVALGIFDGDVTTTEDIITTDNKRYKHNEWHIGMQSVYDEAVRLGYTDWANEIKAYYIDKTMTDHTIYLKIDSILITVSYAQGESDDKGIQNGSYDFENRCVRGGTCYTNTPLQSASPVNPAAIQNAAGWSQSTKNSLVYHYNRYLPDNEQTEENPQVTPGVAAGSIYETKNYSPLYNISRAIPSGENVTNVVSASSVYGDLNVQTDTKSQTYSATYTYYYERPHYEYVESKGGYSYVEAPVLATNQPIMVDTGHHTKVPVWFYSGTHGSCIYTGSGNHNHVNTGEYDLVNGQYVRNITKHGKVFNYTAEVKYNYIAGKPNT